MGHMLGWLLAAVFLAAGVAQAWWLSRNIDSFDRMQRVRAFGGLAGAVGLASAAAFMAIDGNWLLMIVFGVCAVPCLSMALRVKRPRDALQDYAQNPGLCGQCGYDLRGSSSGVCPECGWSVPESGTPIERRDWAMWWRHGWSIQYLNHWRRTLAMFCLYGALFLGMTLYFAFTNPSPFILVVGVIMVGQFTINIIRVVQYGMRQGGVTASPSSRDGA